MRESPKRRVERARQHRFERFVRDAIDQLPEPVLLMLDNVDIVVEEEPPSDRLGGRSESVFGLYQGIPLTERDSAYSMVLPDKITIFRGPLERSFRVRRELVREIQITIAHELGHHVGIDEGRLVDLRLA